MRYYQVDVDVSMIKFSHQPLFSLEHVLEAKLIQLYNQFVLREKSGFREQINNRVSFTNALLKIHYYQCFYKCIITNELLKMHYKCVITNVLVLALSFMKSLKFFSCKMLYSKLKMHENSFEKNYSTH